MSNLYAHIETDAAGPVSRRGHHYIESHTRGWHIGGRVEAVHPSEEPDRVAFDVTHGSANGGSALDLGTYREGMTTAELIAAQASQLAENIRYRLAMKDAMTEGPTPQMRRAAIACRHALRAAAKLDEYAKHAK